MTAKDVEAKLGDVDLTLLSTEGEACFQFQRAPDTAVCFSIDAEQATWKEVRRKNNEVIHVAPLSDEDKDLARTHR